MELVCFFFVLFWYILFILSFGCVTIVNREMKSDAFNDDANFRKSVKLKQK